jgi:small subunit ribosomal protein S18
MNEQENPTTNLESADEMAMRTDEARTQVETVNEQENPATNPESADEVAMRTDEAQVPAEQSSTPQEQVPTPPAPKPVVAARSERDDDNAAEAQTTAPGEYTPPERESRSRRVGSDARLEDVSFRNVELLARFIDGRGRILSRRKTRVSAKMQRRVVRAIKQARHLALLPYTADQSRIVRKRR